MRKKAFTLIELIAVLVILAILALIVTPLVMNIIRKARISADKRSVDAYGRSVELAIATYLLDNGDFPTDISQLSIEYSGNEVVCTTTQINKDSSVFLSGCTVAGRNVDYTYGNDKSPSYTAYSVGDEVTYNNIKYYVIKDSGIKESTVTLLKAEPLTTDEVNQYGGVGTATNHVNVYISNNTSSGSEARNHIGSAWDTNGYGAMAFYGSVTCNGSYSVMDFSGCTNDYLESDVKYVVDAWASDKLKTNDLVVDSTGYSVRLIRYDEYVDLCDTETVVEGTGSYIKYNPQYDWLSNSNYFYWTMSPVDDSYNKIFSVSPYGDMDRSNVVYRSDSHDGYLGSVVRPVITISKFAL